jgi:hypothetical protein
MSGIAISGIADSIYIGDIYTNNIYHIFVLMCLPFYERFPKIKKQCLATLFVMLIWIREV